MRNSRSVDGVCVLVAQTLPELLQALPSNAGIAPCGFTGARSMPTGGGTRPYVLMGKVATQSGSRLRALRLEEGDPLPNAEFQVCRWCLCSCGPDFARAAAPTAVQRKDRAMRPHRHNVNANWRGRPCVLHGFHGLGTHPPSFAQSISCSFALVIITSAAHLFPPSLKHALTRRCVVKRRLVAGSLCHER